MAIMGASRATAKQKGKGGTGPGPAQGDHRKEVKIAMGKGSPYISRDYSLLGELCDEDLRTLIHYLEVNMTPGMLREEPHDGVDHLVRIRLL